MRNPASRPIGVVLCVVAAAIFAAPTLFLPADTHVSVKLLFIVAGSLCLALGVFRVRREDKSRPQRGEDGARPDEVRQE